MCKFANLGLSRAMGSTVVLSGRVSHSQRRMKRSTVRVRTITASVYTARPWRVRKYNLYILSPDAMHDAQTESSLEKEKVDMGFYPRLLLSSRFSDGLTYNSELFPISQVVLGWRGPVPTNICAWASHRRRAPMVLPERHGLCQVFYI